MQRKDYSFRVGLIVVILIFGIIGLLVWQSGMILRATGYRLVGRFENVDGLLKGGNVLFRGYPVGRVAGMKTVTGAIDIEFYVQNDIQIPKDSELGIMFDGLVGEKYLAIVPGKSSEMLKDGARLNGRAYYGLAYFIDLGAQSLIEVQAIAESLKHIVQNPDISKSIDGILAQYAEVAANIGELTAELKGDPNKKGIQDVVENAYLLTDDLRKLSSSLSQDGGLVSSLTEISQNLSQFSRSLNENLDKETLQHVSEVIANIESITSELSGFSDGKSKDASSSKSFIKVIRNTKLEGRSDLAYVPSRETTYFDSNWDIVVDKSFFRLGVGNYSSDTKLQNIQQGLIYNDTFGSRFGLFYSEPGLGFDFYFNALQSRISLDVFNPNSVEVDVNGNIQVVDHLGVIWRLRRNPVTKDYDDFSVGVSYSL